MVQYRPDGGETTSVVNNSNKRIPEGVYPIIIQSRSLRRPLRILIDYWERAHYLMNMNILIQKQRE